MNTKKYTKTKCLFLFLIILFFNSCISLPLKRSADQPKNNDTSPQEKVLGKLNNRQSTIVSAALDSCNMDYTNSLIFNNRVFSNDCSGLIYGIFWSVGIDLISEISKESGNGVKRLFAVMEKNNLLHYNKYPEPGDLIFWNNTYGTWGKNPLSHIGVVVSVDRGGNIEYVHNNTYLGKINIERMNLHTPHKTRPVNNYMRYDSKYKKTSAELFDSFGMAWRL